MSAGSNYSDYFFSALFNMTNSVFKNVYVQDSMKNLIQIATEKVVMKSNTFDNINRTVYYDSVNSKVPFQITEYYMFKFNLYSNQSQATDATWYHADVQDNTVINSDFNFLHFFNERLQSLYDPVVVNRNKFKFIKNTFSYIKLKASGFIRINDTSGKSDVQFDNNTVYNMTSSGYYDQETGGWTSN